MSENPYFFLKSEKYPEHNGLLFASVLIRKHHDENLKKVMEDWWYCVKNYSKRDQLSFNYVAWKNNFVPNTIPGDIRKRNKYVYMLGKHKKNYTYEILKFKIRDFLDFSKIFLIILLSFASAFIRNSWYTFSSISIFFSSGNFKNSLYKSFIS